MHWIVEPRVIEWLLDDERVAAEWRVVFGKAVQHGVGPACGSWIHLSYTNRRGNTLQGSTRVAWASGGRLGRAGTQ